MSETPNTVHGRLLEAAHISGYTMNRACDELAWILEEDRWKQIGEGYDDVNRFLATIDLSEFRLLAEKRKPLARKLAELDASQRATAKALGAGKTTIQEDLTGRKRPNVAVDEVVEAPPDDAERSDATTSAWFQDDVDPAKLAKKSAARSARDEAKKAEREEAEVTAREEIAVLGERAHHVEVGDVRSWRPAGVACVITDPPYISDDAVELHSALADFALEVLPSHGALVVMTWQPLLPAVLDAMRRDRLIYRWTVAWTYGTKERTPERSPRVFDGWKPILVFHKDGWTDDTTYLYDVVVSADSDKEHHEWGQSLGGFRQLVRAFSEHGDLVCDPFVGGGTTALAARAEARKFVGIDTSPDAVRITEERLAA